jgi:TolB-like protein/tRNA A-37 threonylcarbamoyl transferase component Bud32
MDAVGTPPAFPTPLPSFGERYRVERALGRGGMATVYLCLDTNIDRRVAIKLLNPELAAAVGGDRFHREIKIATGLTHPNILPCYDSGEADGSLYYVMPFVEGESLRDRISREGQMTVQDSVRIAGEIASALAYAHSQNIVHRDIKPENILLENDRAVLADFGIARAVIAGTEQLTQTGMSVGTPGYMSPEQALGDKRIDGRSDQYSLACVLYEMLCGDPPFTANTMQALVAKHLSEQVPAITTVRPAVPDEIEDVVMRALEKVPADRFTTMQEFGDALAMAVGQTGTWTRRTAAHRTTRAHRITTEMVQKEKARKRNLVIGGIAAAVLLVGAGVWGAGKLGAGGGGIRQAGLPTGYEANRVAVMYLSDVSGNHSLSDLASGLSEGLIDQLAQVPALSVVSRNAVSAYRDKDVPRDIIAKAFGAPWLIDGAVDANGGDVVVTVKLHDGVSGSVLNTQVVRQKAGATLALRSDLLDKVSEQLRQSIGSQIQLSAQRNDASNDAAWLLVQQADKFRRDAEAAGAEDKEAEMVKAFATADSLLALAETKDAAWTEPTAQRALVAYRQARLTPVSPARLKLFQTAIAHATRAIQRDSVSPQAAAPFEYRGSAWFSAMYDHLITVQREADSAYARALRDLEHSTKLDRRRASAWITLSSAYAQKPDFASSKLAAGNAYEADPFNLNAAAVIDRLYRTSYITETFGDADTWCKKGVARFPADYRFTECALWTYTIASIRPSTDLAPSLDSVRVLADSLPKLAPANRREFFRREGQIIRAIVLGRAGKADSAKKILDAMMDPPRDADPENDLLYQNAYARLTLNDRKTALALLKTYLTRNPEHREGLGKDSAWWWRDLKQDPQFLQLIATGK